MPGTLFVVATPIGNLEDISARALRVLREVAVIAAEDTRRTGHLLARFAITTPSTSLHEHNERSKSRALIARLLEGQSVALVSDAGTPTVSDPGLKLIQQAIAAQIRVEPIPGPERDHGRAVCLGHGRERPLRFSVSLQLGRKTVNNGSIHSRTLARRSFSLKHPIAFERLSRSFRTGLATKPSLLRENSLKPTRNWLEDRFLNYLLTSKDR